MPSCSICGAQMRIIRRGIGKGGKGAKYECPNKRQHKKCPKCGASLITKFAEENYCPKCDYREHKSPHP